MTRELRFDTPMIEKLIRDFERAWEDHHPGQPIVLSGIPAQDSSVRAYLLMKEGLLPPFERMYSGRFGNVATAKAQMVCDLEKFSQAFDVTPAAMMQGIWFSLGDNTYYAMRTAGISALFIGSFNANDEQLAIFANYLRHFMSKIYP